MTKSFRVSILAVVIVGLAATPCQVSAATAPFVLSDPEATNACANTIGTNPVGTLPVLGFGAGSAGAATCANSTITENANQPGTFGIPAGSQTACLKVSDTVGPNLVYADPGCINPADEIANFTAQGNSLFWVSHGGALECVVSDGGVLAAIGGAGCATNKTEATAAVVIKPVVAA
jgi:hypothetical protein